MRIICAALLIGLSLYAFALPGLIILTFQRAIMSRCGFRGIADHKATKSQ